MHSLRRSLLMLLLAAASLAPRAADPDAAPQAATKQMKVIAIETKNSALSLVVGEDGRLYQMDYGKGGRKASPPAKMPAREMEFLPGSGDGYILEPAIQATHADGNTSTNLVYVKDSAETAGGITTTKIEMKDSYYPFFVTLFLKSYADQDVIEQWSEIRHDEDGPVTLYRYASASLLAAGKDARLTQFYGDYKREATIAEEQLMPGIKVLDSKIGVRADRYRIPSFILALGGAATEEKGEVIGGSLEWSGSFQLAFEIDSRNHLRAMGGINPFGSQYRLSKGKTFTTPAMLWTWSDAGKGQLSRNFHHWALKYGVRDGAKPRPILGNNWEATHMDFDEARIVGIFEGAKEIGLELFLLDDGWFGNNHPRDGDNAGLGDWQVKKKALPRGLEYLADEAKNRGLGFGIWIEPEMVNPKSDLYEKHPEWAIVQPHREIELSRNQLNLDLSNPEIEQFAEKVIDDTLKPNPSITYVKWDANRYVTQPGSSYLGKDEQSHVLVDYGFALYQVMEHMAKTYPNVMAMVCSGGGGRVDYGSLKYFHSFWPSDNTDPVDRVKIQWGFSHFFPANTISAHVTRMKNRPTKFALDVAMSGALGVDMDLSKSKPEEKKALAAGIQLYKESLRDIVQQGDLYRLESPYEGQRAALNYVSADQNKAVLFVYQLQDGKPQPVKVRGLDPKKNYKVTEVNLPDGAVSALDQQGKSILGERLMNEGVMPTAARSLDSNVVVLTAEM